MSRPLVLVVDDQPFEHRRFRLAGQRIANVCDLEEIIEGEWDAVAKRLVEVEGRSAGRRVLVLLDLAITGSDPAEAERGLTDALRLQAKFSAFQFGLFTGHVILAGRARDAFRPIVDKQRLERAEMAGDAAAYLEECLSSFLPDLRSTQPTLSCSTPRERKVFEAVLGPGALTRIVTATEAASWQGIVVEFLSPGFSGARVMKVKGVHAGVARCLVLKAVFRDNGLEHESQITTDDLSALGELAPLVVPVGACKHAILESGVVQFYVQSFADGSTLFDLLAVERDADARAVLREVRDALIRQYEGALASEPFGQTCRIEALRAEVIATELRRTRAFGDLCVTEKLLPHDGPTWAAMITRVENVVRGFEEWTSRVGAMRVAYQHGDLHPRNALQLRGGRVVLIDYGRMGVWPVGYDLSRLALQLRVMCRAGQASEQFPAKWDWTSPPVSCDFSGVAHEGRELAACDSLALECDRGFAEWAEGRENSAQSLLGYEACAVFDLLNMLGYADISAPRRVWLVVEADAVLRRIDERIGERARWGARVS